MSASTLAGLWDRACSGGRADFLVLPDRRFSYADLEQSVRRWLACFDQAGLRPGDRIVIRSRHDTVMASGFVAALLDGLVPVLLAADTPELRLRSIHAKVQARCVVLDDDGAVSFGPDTRTVVLPQAGAPRAGGLRWFVRAPDPLSLLATEAAARAPRLETDRSALAYILFTSGTTASPSGVMITRGNLLANVATLSRMFGYQRESRIFNDMLLAHADGMVQGPLLALANGCAVIRSGGFTLPGLEAWLNRVRAERATHVITVPTVWSMIATYARFDDYFDAPECRLLLSVAAKLPESLWSGLEQRFGRPVCNQYGLTETVASALYAGPLAGMGGFGSIGLPVDCEARVDPLAPVPGEGELQLRGDNVFHGYWQDEERTRSCFTEDGWMKTGDLVRQRADGAYEYLGRLKSVIMMGGFLIRPDEIDEAMLAHPAVRESVTVAVEDEVFGEVPYTAVVCAQAVDEAALTAHARARLEGRKVPKRIVAVAGIPRGLSGKPKLQELTAELLRATQAQQPGAGDQATAHVKDAVLALAADVFRVRPEQLELESSVGDVPGWDSFSHLNFVLAVEARFGVTIPAAQFAAIRSIEDMVRAVGTARS